MFYNLIKGSGRQPEGENIVSGNIQKLLGDKNWEKRKKGAQELSELVSLILEEEKKKEKEIVNNLINVKQENTFFNEKRNLSEKEINKILKVNSRSDSEINGETSFRNNGKLDVGNSVSQEKVERRVNTIEREGDVCETEEREEDYKVGAELIQKALLDICKKETKLNFSESGVDPHLSFEKKRSCDSFNAGIGRVKLKDILNENNTFSEEINKKYQNEKIMNIIDFIESKFICSVNVFERYGGLVSLAYIAISLDKKIKFYFTYILKIIISCINDTDNKVRYYVSESLYNVCKAAQEVLFFHIDDLFDCLCKLFADSSVDVNNGGMYLDMLLKDMTCSYNNICNVYKIIYIMKEKIRIGNSSIRQLVVSWIFFLKDIPAINIFGYFHFFIKDLFLMLSDNTKDIPKLANQCLDFYIDIIITSDYGQCRTIFKLIAPIFLELIDNKNTIIKQKILLWVYHFINILNFHFYNIFKSEKKNNQFLIEFLKRIIFCTSDVNFDIHYTARKCNERLIHFLKFSDITTVPLITKLVCDIIKERWDDITQVLMNNSPIVDKNSNLPSFSVEANDWKRQSSISVESQKKQYDQHDTFEQYKKFDQYGKFDKYEKFDQYDKYDKYEQYEQYEKENESISKDVSIVFPKASSEDGNYEKKIDEPIYIESKKKRLGKDFKEKTVDSVDEIKREHTEQEEWVEGKNQEIDKCNENKMCDIMKDEREKRSDNNHNNDNIDREECNDIKDIYSSGKIYESIYPNVCETETKTDLEVEVKTEVEKEAEAKTEAKIKKKAKGKTKVESELELQLEAETEKNNEMDKKEKGKKEESYKREKSFTIRHEKFLNKIKEKKGNLKDISKLEAHYINSFLKNKKSTNNNKRSTVEKEKKERWNDQSDNCVDGIEARDIYPIIICLEWLIEILLYKSEEIKMYYDYIIYCVFKCFKSGDRKILYLSLTVLSAMCYTTNNKFEFYNTVSKNIIVLFKNDETLLIQKGKMILQNITGCLNNKKLYVYLCNLLIYENDYTFVNKCVQILNWILLTSDETRYLRNILFLKKYFHIFSIILIAWFQNPLSAISFLLWMQKYELAYFICSHLTLIHVNADFLQQLDNFIFLFESPVFAKQRMHLIAPQKHSFLIKSLMILSLMLPLNTSNNILQKRLHMSQLSFLISSDNFNDFLDCKNTRPSENNIFQKKHVDEEIYNEIHNEINNEINNQDENSNVNESGNEIEKGGEIEKIEKMDSNKIDKCILGKKNKIKKQEENNKITDTCEENVTDEMMELFKLEKEEDEKEYYIIEKTENEKKREYQQWDIKYNTILNEIINKFLKDGLMKKNIYDKYDEHQKFIYIFKTILKSRQIINYYI